MPIPFYTSESAATEDSHPESSNAGMSCPSLDLNTYDVLVNPPRGFPALMMLFWLIQEVRQGMKSFPVKVIKVHMIVTQDEKEEHQMALKMRC